MTSQLCPTLSEQFLLTLQNIVIDTKIYRGSVPFLFNYKSTLKFYLLKTYNTQQKRFISLSHMFHLPIHYFPQFTPFSPPSSSPPVKSVTFAPFRQNFGFRFFHSLQTCWACGCGHVGLVTCPTFHFWRVGQQFPAVTQWRIQQQNHDHRNSHIIRFFIHKCVGKLPSNLIYHFLRAQITHNWLFHQPAPPQL